VSVWVSLVFMSVLGAAVASAGVAVVASAGAAVASVASTGADSLSATVPASQAA